MTGNVLKRLREARGISLADIRDMSPYMAVALHRLELYGVSWRKGAKGGHNGRRRRHWRRAMRIIREATKRGGR